MVQAKIGEAKLVVFETTKKDKMIPLQKWLGKIIAKDKLKG